MIEAGIEDFVILEKASDLGGVWRDNTYPGCACDVPGPLYSLSFAPSAEWSRIYPPQAEILRYLHAVAHRHQVESHVRYEMTVLGARWASADSCWRIETNRGTILAPFLIAATGPFGEPIVPAIPGRESFRGEVFHSSRWNDERRVRGKRVAVIGTGASAAQLIPAIQPEVSRLVVFQRAPAWVIPRIDVPVGRLQRRMLRDVPGLRRAMRAVLFALAESLGVVAFVDRRARHVLEGIARLQLRLQIKDAALRKRLTPRYVIGCKRIVSSSSDLPAIESANVKLVTEGIAEITPLGIRTVAGIEHQVDTVIWATGFEAPSRRLSIIRRADGKSMVDLYDERPQSYWGTTIAGFPNLFMLLAPYALAGNQSALYMIESQCRYIVDALRIIRTRGVAVCEVRSSAQDRFLAYVERRSENTVWVDGGCRSYYQTSDGRNAGLWPHWSFLFARRLRRFDPDAYEMRSE